MKHAVLFLVLMLGFSPSAFAFLGGGASGGNTLGLSCTSGQVPEWSGSGFTQCLTASGSGTVTSVGLGVDTTLTSILSVSGSPVTASGSFTLSLATQAKNTLFAGPASGSNAAPTFRLLTGADLPAPSATTLGGVESYAAVSHQWINAISTSGVPSSSQPSVSDVSGAAPLASPSFTGTVTSPNLVSSSANAASTGTIRLANGDSVSFRNYGNTADLPLGVNSSNQLTFNGSAVGGSATWGSITGTLSSQTDLNTALSGKLSADGTTSPTGDFNWNGHAITQIQTLGLKGVAPTLSVYNTSTDYSHLSTINISGDLANDLQVIVSGQLVADFASSPMFGSAYAKMVFAPGNNSEIRLQSDNYSYTNLVWQADGTTSDIGTNDGGTTLARPRDLWLWRDVRLGNGIRIKEGTNQRMGVATLSAGTATVANTSVTANTRIFLTVQTAGGTQGFLSTSRTAGTSFTITSTSASETSTVAWMLVEPN